MKHHFRLLPDNFGESLMPEFCDAQLQNRITRISLDQMYNYSNTFSSTDTSFKSNCVKIWNNQPFDFKLIPYISNKGALYKSFKL